MSDNITTQSATPATPPSGIIVAARLVGYSGDQAYIAPSAPVAFAGADDAKVGFDLGAATGGHHVAAGSGDATVIKNAAGLLTGVHVFNNAAYPVYVKFHNSASAPTPGAAVVHTVGVQAGVGRDVLYPVGGRYFSAGIGISIVKGIADTDTNAVAAGDCVVDIDYN